MRSTDVTTMTVVYHRQEGKYAPAHRTVVLSTELWTPIRAAVRPASRFGSAVSGFQRVGSPKAGLTQIRGWLCLDTFSASPHTEDELCALAGPALAVLESGGLPELPAGVTVALVPARDVVQTWADWVAQQDRDREALETSRLAAEERAAADRAARQRIADVVGEQTLAPLALELRSRAGGWVALESVLTAYHQAQQPTVAPADAGTTALLDAAEAIEARALNAGRIIRTDGQQALCGSPGHDDRWCSDCDRMESGMFRAAEMLRDLAAPAASV